MQAAPVWGDATATTRRVVEYLEQAASQDVELCVFPETFLPGFPFWGILEGVGDCPTTTSEGVDTFSAELPPVVD